MSSGNPSEVVAESASAMIPPEQPAEPKVYATSIKEHFGKRREGLSVMEKFRLRLEREGRLKQFKDRVKELNSQPNPATGKKWGYSQTKWVAAREMGYTIPELEHRLHQEWEAAEKAKQKQEVAEELVGDWKDAETFEEALRTLPVRASEQVETDWILGHQAMTRKARSRNNLDPVLITSYDILDADHGPCPSRAAAIKLQHWANKPDELYKALTGAVKKGSDTNDGTRDSESDSDPGKAEIERFLKEVGG